MDWTRTIDAYCERTGPEFWAEPVNAVTNLAFLLAAVLVWRQSGAALGGRVLAILLGFIGMGSFLFHTFATPWAGLLDVVPILGFVLVYLYLANRDYLGWPLWLAALGTLAFVPYTFALVPLFRTLPVLGVSAVYWPLPVLIFAYAIWLRRRLPQVSRGLVIGGGILVLSLLARSFDEVWCDALPLGTHFLWHVLNGVMLGWMSLVWLQHRARIGREG